MNSVRRESDRAWLRPLRIGRSLRATDGTLVSRMESHWRSEPRSLRQARGLSHRGFRESADSHGREVAGSGLRVVHMTTVHDAWDHRIFAKECRTLTRAGYRVTLVVPASSNSLLDGVRINAVPFPVNRIERMTRTLRHVYRAAVREDADLYHFHDPELIVVGLLLKLRRKRVVYDVHEDMVMTIRRKGWLRGPFLLLRPAIAVTVGIIERFAVHVLDAAVLVIPMPHRKFPPSKCVLVRNFPELGAAFEPVVPYQKRAHLLAYVGGIAVGRGAADMVTAMALVRPELQARLLVAGWFQPSDLEIELRALSGVEHVDFVGTQSRDEVAALLGRARIGLCVLHPDPGYPDSYPVKLFEYMLAGLPVIASNFPAWAEIVEGANCGILIEPQDPAALASAVTLLLENPGLAESMGMRGRDAIVHQYNWGSESRQLLSLYRHLIPGLPGSR